MSDGRIVCEVGCPKGHFDVTLPLNQEERARAILLSTCKVCGGPLYVRKAEA